MFRVTSLTSMDDRQLNRWIKRVALLLVAGVVLFTGFYVFDRWRAPSTPIVDRQLSALEQAVRDNPENIVARGQLADTYVAKARYDEAIAQYDAILDTGKAEQLATYGRAAAYMGLEQYDLAPADYEARVEIAKGGEMANVDPMLQASYYQLGSIAMKQGKPAEAIPQLEKALTIKRSDADALYLIGTAYVATGENEKAVTALRGRSPSCPIGWSEPYAALAEAFTTAGKPAMAEWATAMADLAAGKPEPPSPASWRSPTATRPPWRGHRPRPPRRDPGDTAAAAEWYGKALATSARQRGSPPRA